MIDWDWIQRWLATEPIMPQVALHPKDYCGWVGRAMGVTAKGRKAMMDEWKRNTGKDLEPNE